MKVMKKKMIGLIICMLMLTTIPLAAGMNDNQETELAKGKRAKTFVMGTIGFARVSFGGKYITAFALNVNAFTLSTGGNGGHHIYRLQFMRFPNKFTGFITAPFICGFIDGAPL